MSNTKPEITFKDRYQPSLTAGDWEVKITQSLSDSTLVEASILVETFSKTQEFSINARGFTLESNAVLASYPPPGSKGPYENRLAHVVLRSAALPWGRSAGQGVPVSVPWLGLVVFSAEEIVSPGSDEYGAFTAAVGEFTALGGVEAARSRAAYTESSADFCKYIRLSPQLAEKALPYADELEYLAHCRMVDTEPSPDVNQRDDGMSTVITANRFAQSKQNGQAVLNIAHLVSFEGLTEFLAPGKTPDKDIVLPSLHAWSFECSAETRGEFCRQLADMAESAYSGGVQNAGALRLMLPVTAASLPENARRRVAEGYVPLAYYARTGEQSFAWYRPPLTPVPVAKWDKKATPFFSADAAMIYDAENGVFDLSLAAAWEAGRTSALSDKTFMRSLLEIRARAQTAADALINRVGSGYFKESTVSDAKNGLDARAAFNKVLSTELFKTLSNPAKAYDQQSFLEDNPDWWNPVGAVRKYIDDEAVKACIYEAVDEMLPSVSEWLAKLFLLYRVSFEHLVPIERMLPQESIRFFYVDETWLSALMDGALSVGLDSSRQTKFSVITKSLIFENAMRVLSVLRKKRYTETGSGKPPGDISGFLIRSAAVRDWPNFELYPSSGERTLNILRLDYLAPDLLICLLDGIPDRLVFKVPSDGAGFGTLLERKLYLRKASERGSKPIGTALGAFSLNAKGCMRSGGVLNISPASTDGLAVQLEKALGAENLPPDKKLTPAVFALQLELIREAIEFNTDGRVLHER